MVYGGSSRVCRVPVGYPATLLLLLAVGDLYVTYFKKAHVKPAPDTLIRSPSQNHSEFCGQAPPELMTEVYVCRYICRLFYHRAHACKLGMARQGMLKAEEANQGSP